MQTVQPLDSLEQQVRTAVHHNDLAAVTDLLREQHPADVADILDRLPHHERLLVFEHLTPSQAADVLSETDYAATRDLLRTLDPERTRDLLQQIAVDDVVEILGEDVPGERQRLLEVLEPHTQQTIRAMLAYPPRSAGRLMNAAFIAVAGELTAAAVLHKIAQVSDDVETINDLYVCDEQRHLEGVVRLRAVLAAAPDTPLAALLAERLITVTPETDQEEVARLVSQYDLLSIPVVDDAQRLLGIITVDDVVDVLVQEGNEDVLRLGAVQSGATDETYFGVPIARSIQRRIGWLLLLFLTSVLTVNVLEIFEDVLAQEVALSFFIPLLIGTGGNTGAQSVSTLVRSLAMGDVRMRDMWRVIEREVIVGLLLGILLGVAGFGLALVLGNTTEIALVIGLTIIAICTWSNVMGSIVPIIAQRFGLDPALVSAPLITTLVDATGLAIYMLIAQWILQL